MEKLVKKRTLGHASMYLIAIFFSAILIGVGYAYLSSSLEVTGTSAINKASWNIHFENVRKTAGNVDTEPPIITQDSTILDLSLALNNPGDYYEFNVDVKNSGTIDGMVSELLNLGIDEEWNKFLTYKVTYSDDIPIEQHQLLAAGQKETIKVYIKYRDDAPRSDMPSEDKSLDIELNLTYEQAGSEAVEIPHIICKRASTLHKETCNNTGNNGCKATPETSTEVTYGNLGSGETLKSGDAFDCDVNGDGTYDPEEERFYYVTDLDTNNKYAVLMYYSNIKNGVPDNIEHYAYDRQIRPRENGPISSLNGLPTTSQWPNVRLYKTKRVIKDEKSNEYVKFNYSGYAARLLTAQEINKACNITVGSSNTGELDNCRYLMEKTVYAGNAFRYGYWLESPYSAISSQAFYLHANLRIIAVSSTQYADTAGLRPAIEILKSKISY